MEFHNSISSDRKHTALGLMQIKYYFVCDTAIQSNMKTHYLFYVIEKSTYSINIMKHLVEGLMGKEFQLLLHWGQKYLLLLLSLLLLLLCFFVLVG